MPAGGLAVRAALAGLLVRRFRRAAGAAFRQAMALVVAVALIGAGMPAGLANAHASAGIVTVHHQHSSAAPNAKGDPSPCGHQQSGCMSELGCLLVVGILPVPTRVTEASSSMQQDYWPRTLTGRGITAEPVLAPPIRG